MIVCICVEFAENVHYSSWYSSSTYSRGTILEPNAENEAITFDDSQVSSPKLPQLFLPTVHHFKAVQTHLFSGDPISI